MPEPRDVKRPKEVLPSSNPDTGGWDGYRPEATMSGSEVRRSPPLDRGFVASALDQLDRLHLEEGVASSRSDTESKAPEKVEEVVDKISWYNVWRWYNMLHMNYNEYIEEIRDKRVKINEEINNAKSKRRSGGISKKEAEKKRQKGKQELSELDDEEKGVDQNLKYLEEIKNLYLIMAENGYKITEVNFSSKPATQEMLGPFLIDDDNTKARLGEIGVRVVKEEATGRTIISFDLERRSLRRLKSKLIEITGIILRISR